MNKYNSIYTKEQFENAIDLLENTWTQLEFVGGQEGQEVIIYPGSSVLVENLMTNYSDSDWQYENAVGGLTDTSFMLYPNYNKLWVRSSDGSSSQSSSKCKMEVTVIPGHIYYLSAIADGIVSNENPTSNQYNTVCNRYGISLEKTDVSDSVANEFYQDLNVHELSCVGQIPTQDNGTYIVSLYSNKDTVSHDAVVYFGCVALVDLTAAFGAGKEPDKIWCDSWLKFYDGNISRDKVQVGAADDSRFLHGEFDSDGKCLISVPGFGFYTAFMIDKTNATQNIVYYSNIEVNKIKRYSIDITDFRD